MIKLVNDTIDKNDVNQLIEWLGSNPRLTKGPVTLELERKWSDWLGVENSIFCNSGSSANLLMLWALVEAGRKVILKYRKNTTYGKWFQPDRTCSFRVNRYDVGGFMSEHVDNIHHSHKQEYGFPQGSLLYFLNDNYEGGEIVIADTMYKPKKNSAILFPSCFMFPHYVNKITKGTRYSIITWLM